LLVEVGALSSEAKGNFFIPEYQKFSAGWSVE
jgi:hypothetical protein